MGWIGLDVQVGMRYRAAYTLLILNMYRVKISVRSRMKTMIMGRIDNNERQLEEMCQASMSTLSLPTIHVKRLSSSQSVREQPICICISLSFPLVCPSYPPPLGNFGKVNQFGGRGLPTAICPIILGNLNTMMILLGWLNTIAVVG